MIGLRQQLGKIELVGTGFSSGFEVGTGPISRGLGELGVKPTCLATIAVMLVISEKPSQIAQVGLGAGGEAALAIAVGAERRCSRDARVAQLLDLGLGQRLEVRAASEFSRTWSVLRIETQHDANRSSVQIACKSA